MNDLPGLLRRVGTYAGLLGATHALRRRPDRQGYASASSATLASSSECSRTCSALSSRSASARLAGSSCWWPWGRSRWPRVWAGSAPPARLTSSTRSCRSRSSATRRVSRSRPTSPSGASSPHLGLIALLTIIISGTFAGGGGIGSNTDPKVYQLNLHMYAIAGFLALIAWLLAIINTFRIHAWGWFATSVLLFGIGALMFGLFGPTAEDVRQGRLQKAARRAAGVR